MMHVVTLAAAAEREAALAAELSVHPGLDLLMRCVERVEALAAIRSGRADAILSVGRPEWFDLQCRKEATAAGLRAILLDDDPGEDPWWSAVLPSNATIDEISVALHDASAPLAEPRPGTEKSGRLIAVWGPKGAPGRTRVAIELSYELADILPTLLIDGDTYGGDVMQLLGVLDEVPTVIWAARMAAKGELDEIEFATNFRRTASNGPVVLPGIPRGELWAEVSEFGWRELLKVVRASFGFSVIDVGFCIEPPTGSFVSDEGRNHLTRHAIAEADHVIAVSGSGSTGLKHFLWAFSDLRNIADPDQVVIAVNKVKRGQEREIAELFRRHLGKRVAVFFPDRKEEVEAATARGLAVRETSKDSPIGVAAKSLGVLVGARPSPKGLMTRLAGAR